MTREEQIAVAFDDYSDARKLSTFDDFEYTDIQVAFEEGAEWADSTYVKGDIEKESELYAQSVVGDISEDMRHLLATAYIAGAKRIER